MRNTALIRRPGNREAVVDQSRFAKVEKLMAQSSNRRIASLAKKAAFVAERFMRIDVRGFHQGQGNIAHQQAGYIDANELMPC